jgi:hypothetical protein
LTENTYHIKSSNNDLISSNINCFDDSFLPCELSSYYTYLLSVKSPSVYTLSPRANFQ